MMMIVSVGNDESDLKENQPCMMIVSVRNNKSNLKENQPCRIDL